MMYRTPTEPTSWTDRAIRLLTDPRRRVAVLILVAYLAAGLGLGVAFFSGINNPNSDVATVGIILLFVSFAILFYVSVTVLALDQAD